MDVKPTEGTSSATVDPFSPQEAEEFSIDALLKNLEVFQRRQQLETLERVIMENSWLEHHIARYRESLSRTTKLLQEVYKAVALMQNGLEKSRHKESEADRAWLAFWGINAGRQEGHRDHKANWI
ncbi:hypothetical protein F5884DRAFT_868568 [Xylogone sp. PMI_703]|nr:hypothetical protein F5884DRAFT_868568 [Xylogone sp. PMI_703]